MITEMTKEQEAQVPVYHEKFLNQGLNTKRLDVDKAVSAIKSLYKVLGLSLDENPLIKVYDSPEAMCNGAAELDGDAASTYLEKINWGNSSNYWISFYSFINNVLGVTNEEERVRVAESIGEHCGPFLMFEKAILISQRPNAINMLPDRKTLHKEYGPSIDHADGLSRTYHLNGVKVTEKAACTKPEDFTKEDILNEKNADIRAQILIRIPAATLITILEPKELDSEFGYTLLGINLGDDRGHRPFLKMLNPSEGIIHIEGVTRDCTTVRDAIKFRNTLEKFSLPRTLDGKDLFNEANELKGKYHAQGDCLAFIIDQLPTGATKSLDTIVGDGMRRHHSHGNDIFVHDGIRYLQSDKQIEVVHEATHGTMILPAGTYKIVKVREYDHWLEESREVVD